jgi:hypothetical protein
MLVLSSLQVLGSCGVVEPDAGREMTLYVAPTTVACVGEAPQRCLQVRERPEDPWGWFYDPIAGFTHEEGVSYTLDVLRRTVVDPPADGSSYSYTLLRIVSRVPAS